MSDNAKPYATATVVDTSPKPDITSPHSPPFFERNAGQRSEIIEGLIREQQLVTFSGPYGVGKSPALADIAFHVLHGIPWCGRRTAQRPLVHFDFETPGSIYKTNLRSLSSRFGVALPTVPEQIDVYLEHDDATEQSTKKLLDTLAARKLQAGLELVRSALSTKPNALVIIDPLELLFCVDTGKKQPVLELYSNLRRLMSAFPRAAILTTFNLRKLDGKRQGRRASLLLDPRTWLDEVCGTLDILNRSDVRLGMDLHEDEMRVINGIRRGEPMDPLIVRPVLYEDEPCGFELCPPNASNLSTVFTGKQIEYWKRLPQEFHFDDIADKEVPRVSLYRVLGRAKSLGMVAKEGSVWKKVDLVKPAPVAVAKPLKFIN